MYYGHLRICAAEKVLQLQALLSSSDTLADAISLASLKSRRELTTIAETGREILRDVAVGDAPTLVAAFKVPIIGQSSIEKLQNRSEELDRCVVPQLEARLEMNLALMYTLLIHTNGYDSLISKRGELVGRAGRKWDPENLQTRMQLCQRLGTIRYFDIAAISSGQYPHHSAKELSEQFKDSYSMLDTAKSIARGYTAYDEFLATFNLGRLEFIQGKNKNRTKSYLNNAQGLQKSIQNKFFEDLTTRYLNAVEDDRLYGTIISDPVEYQIMLKELASFKVPLSRIITV